MIELAEKYIELEKAENASKESKRQKREYNTDNKTTLNIDDSKLGDIKDTAIKLIKNLPPRQKGSGQYSELRDLIWGLCSMFTIESGISFDDDRFTLELAQVKGLIEDSPAKTDYKQGWFPKKIIESYDPSRKGENDAVISSRSFFKNFNILTNSEVSYSQFYYEFDKEEWKKKQEELLKAVQKQYRDLSRNPNILVEKKYCDFRDLPANFFESFSGLFGIKAAKSTGKSKMIGYTDEFDGNIFPAADAIIGKAKENDFNIIALTCRRSLCEEISIRWGITFINHGASSKGKYQYTFMNDTCACIDSLKSYRDRLERNPDEKILLILDEAESFRKHLLTSETLKEYREEIIKLFHQIFKLIKRNGGIIILSDADLSDATFDYFQDVSLKENGCKLDEFIYRNDYKLGKKIFYVPSEAQLEQLRDEDIKAGHNIIYSCDGREHSQAITNLLPKDKKTILINSHTVGDKDTFARDFLKNPNEFIEEEKPNYLVHTGSMGMGVSIDIVGHFNKVYCRFFGAADPEDVRQQLWRLRDLFCEVYWYAPEVGCKFRERYDFTQEKALEQIIEEKKDSLEASGIYHIAPVEAVKALFDANAEIAKNDPENKATALIKAVQNYGQKHYKELIEQQLYEEGNILACVIPPEKLDKKQKEEVTEKKKEIKKEENKQAVDAPKISVEQAVELSNNAVSSDEDRAKITKAFLLHELPLLPVDELNFFNVLSDKKRTYAKIRLRFLMEHPEIANFYDRKAWHTFAEKILTGIPLLSDVKGESHKVRVLNYLDIPAFIERGNSGTVNGKCPMLKEFRNKCLKDDVRKKQIKTAFGINVNKHGQTHKWIKKILATIGFKFAYSNDETSETWQITPMKKNADSDFFDQYSNYSKLLNDLLEKHDHDVIAAGKEMRSLEVDKEILMNLLHPQGEFCPIVYESLLHKYKLDSEKLANQKYVTNPPDVTEISPSISQKVVGETVAQNMQGCQEKAQKNCSEVIYTPLTKKIDPEMLQQPAQNECDRQDESVGFLDWTEDLTPPNIYGEDDPFWGNKEESLEINISEGGLDTIEDQNNNNDFEMTNVNIIDPSEDALGESLNEEDDDSYQDDKQGGCTGKLEDIGFNMGDEVMYLPPDGEWCKGIFGTVDPKNGYFWVWDAKTFNEVPCSRYQVTHRD